MFREETVHSQSQKGFAAQCVDKPWAKQCWAKKLLGMDRACEDTGVSSKEDLCLFVCLFVLLGNVVLGILQNQLFEVLDFFL